MPEESYRTLGRMSGTAVGVQPTRNGQEILIEHSDLGRRLACLISCDKADIF